MIVCSRRNFTTRDRQHLHSPQTLRLIPIGQLPSGRFIPNLVSAFLCSEGSPHSITIVQTSIFGFLRLILDRVTTPTEDSTPIKQLSTQLYTWGLPTQNPLLVGFELGDPHLRTIYINICIRTPLGSPPRATIQMDQSTSRVEVFTSLGVQRLYAQRWSHHPEIVTRTHRILAIRKSSLRRGMIIPQSKQGKI